MVIDDFNAKTYAQSKRGKRHMKKRDHRYGSVHGHTVSRHVLTDTRPSVGVEHKRSPIEQKMLSELGLYPFGELSQMREFHWGRRRVSSLDKRKQWEKIQNIESYVESCGAEIVAEQESFDCVFHSREPQYQPTKSYAIKTDLPTGSELNELYAHYRNNNQDKFVPHYVQENKYDQTTPRDRWCQTIRYANLKQFLPHGLIHEQLGRSSFKTRACCEVVFNGPQTVVAFSFFPYTWRRLRLRQVPATRFQVSYRIKDDQDWKLLKEITRTRKENIEQVFTLDFLADKESLEVSELRFEALDSGDFTVRVYGSAVNVSDEEEKHRILVGSLKTGEYDDVVLKVTNCDPERKQRLALKRRHKQDRWDRYHLHGRVRESSKWKKVRFAVEKTFVA